MVVASPVGHRAAGRDKQMAFTGLADRKRIGHVPDAAGRHADPADATCIDAENSVSAVQGSTVGQSNTARAVDADIQLAGIPRAEYIHRAAPIDEGTIAEQLGRGGTHPDQASAAHRQIVRLPDTGDSRVSAVGDVGAVTVGALFDQLELFSQTRLTPGVPVQSVLCACATGAANASAASASAADARRLLRGVCSAWPIASASVLVAGTERCRVAAG